jgi:DNA (cytosine-5)-methyltransferase 1
MNKTMTHSSYFAGIGGFCLGAERAGIRTVYTCEIDEYRHEILKNKYKDAIHETDIRTATGITADIFSAGFPCQDISSANPNGKGLQGARSGLFFDFTAAVSRFRPTYVVLENSPNVVSQKEIALEIFGQITSLGYDAEWAIIPKRAFGYADERERFIFVAYDNQKRCNAGNRIFDEKSFVPCCQQISEKRQLEFKLGRTSRLSLWRNFIARTCKGNSGLSRELVENEIAAYGDAICPDVAELLFRLILEFENRNKLTNK